nr:MAG TPA: hypothetical protein [Caudoviricetes sp.]
MNYNQILYKVNENTRKKVSDEYNKIYNSVKLPQDYNGSVNKIDSILNDKNIKIDDTLRNKLKEKQKELIEAIKNKDLKKAANIKKDLDGLPSITKNVNAKDFLKLVDKRDLAYIAMDRFLDKEITNRIYNTLHIKSIDAVPGAIANKRAEIISIIKTYKHIKNSNPELANQVIQDLSTNINKQLDEELKYAKNKYYNLAQQQAGKRIDDLYSRAHSYIEQANKQYESLSSRALYYEDQINSAISRLNNIQLGGFAKTVNMNLQLSKVSYVSSNLEKVNKYMAKYNELARKHLDRAKTWATDQIKKLASKALEKIGGYVGKVAKSALGKFKL